MKRPRGAVKKLWLPDPSSFWKKVNRTDVGDSACWVWCGWVSNSSTRNPRSGGYGLVTPSTIPLRKTHATLMAHRVSWEYAHGAIPEGMLVLHYCDNRACVRPDHLFLGNDKDNMDDMYQKKRGHKSHGEEQHLAKLTDEAVRIIRVERAKQPPTPIQELANRFGVTTPAISYAANGKTWKHVT